jgi:ligand-binding sensor domain-containing protein
MFFKAKVLFFNFFLYTSSLLLAQENYQCAQIGLSEGLSDLRIQDITQDPYGYLWFATLDGLNRYDGYTITNYYSDTTFNGLPNSSIYSLFTDSKGELWIGTGNGLVKFNYNNQDFIRIDTNSGMSHSLIRMIKEDPEGNLYVGGSGGLFRLDKKKNQWQSITKYLNRDQDLKLVRDVHFINSDHFYVTTEKKGFYEIELSKRSCELIIYDDEKGLCLVDILMYEMEALNKDELLISFLSPGINKFNMKTGKFTRVAGPLSESKDIYWNTVPKIYKDHQNRIWIASTHFGLCEYLYSKDSIISYTNSRLLPYGIHTGPLVCIFQDKQNNIWLGTREQGILRFNPERQCAFFFDQDDYQNNKLQNSSVNALHLINNQTALIGSQEGFSLFNYQTRTFTNYKGQAINKQNNYLRGVTTFDEDPQGNYWLGTSGLGIMKWNPKTFQIQGYNRSSSQTMVFPEDFIFQTSRFSDGNILTLGLGRLSLIDIHKLQTTTFRNSKKPVLNLKDIQLIHELGQDKCYLLQPNGTTYFYDYLLDSLTHMGNFLITHFPKVSISKMVIEQSGTIWFASNFGLIKMDKDSCLSSYILESKGSHNTIHGFQKIDNTIWMANNHKLGKLDLETGKVQFLTEADGFYQKQLNGQSLIQLNNGMLYIGCKDGLYEIQPTKFIKPKINYQARLISFKILNKSGIQNCLEENCSYQLNYHENYFSFQLSAFQYDESKELQYEYKLVGYDQDWNRMGKDRMGFYTKVNPGSYLLQFRVKSVSGDWILSNQTIHLEVLPPFWQTKIFLLFIIIIVGIFIYWFIQFKLQTVQREERLRSEFEIKIHELENSALRTQMNPHFIFNCLNTINAFVQKNDRTNAGLMISKFSKLIRMILNHSKEKRISLKEELDALELYIQVESTRFESKFEYQINIAPGIYVEGIEFPSLIFQPFVENSILHGLLPLNKKGLLTISIIKVETHLLCIIEDNGIGRDASKKLRPYQSHQKSYGIEITLKRIELFNQEHKFPGIVNIIDLKHPDGSAAGTRIELPIALSFSF